MLTASDRATGSSEPRGQRARNAAYAQAEDALARRILHCRQVAQIQGQVRHLESENEGNSVVPLYVTVALNVHSV